MSERYKRRFQQLQERNHKAFMPFTLLGWPDRNRSLALIKQMIDEGASALELGFAFSDPVADGPVIQAAAFETLETGFTVDNGFALIKEVRKLDADIPVGVLVYYNLVMKKGAECFFAQAKDSGIDGVLIADLPVDFSADVVSIAERNGISLIFLISPVSPESRIRSIARKASGFIYLLSRLGVTGINAGDSQNDAKLAAIVDVIRQVTDTPICAGFGISSGETARRMIAAGVDGVITGSKVIDLAKSKDSSKNLAEFYQEMLKACSSNEQKMVHSKAKG
ncbi:MAG TPA: tryptophan synthase subunit alpha [Oculatellaceae cyanobacterium]